MDSPELILVLRDDAAVRSAVEAILVESLRTGLGRQVIRELADADSSTKALRAARAIATPKETP